MRALVEAAADVAGVKKAIQKIASAKTPEAWAAIFDIAIDPPKLPFRVNTSFFAMSAIKRALKKTADVQELLIARCAKAPVDVEEWEFPILLLGSFANANRQRAFDDKRILEGLRRSLVWEHKILPSNAVFVLTRILDHGALPKIVALLDRGQPKHDHLVGSIAEAMQKLVGATAKDLAKLEAARAGIKNAFVAVKLDKTIAKLKKRF